MVVKAIWMDVKFVGRAESTLLFTPLDYFYLTQFSFLQMEHFYRKASYLAIQKTSLNFCLFPEQSASVCQGLGMHRLCAGTICTVPVQILTPALGSFSSIFHIKKQKNRTRILRVMQLGCWWTSLFCPKQ